MSFHKNQKGFTFIEVIIALSIMAIGFLATSQMQFLSLRQKQLAEDGTIATNIIQFIADQDMSTARQIHLLNSIAFIEALAGRLSPLSTSEPHLQHCIGEKNICDECPCDPLKAITPTITDDTVETTCAIVNPYEVDPKKIVYESDENDCTLGEDDGGSVIIIKQVAVDIDTNSDDTALPQEYTLTVTYAVKNSHQYENSDFDSIDLKDTVASQEFIITGYQTDWSETIGTDGWKTVNVPNFP